MTVLQTSFLIAALVLIAYGTVLFCGHSLPWPPRSRFSDKPWYSEYCRTSGRGVIVSGIGLLVVTVLLIRLNFTADLPRPEWAVLYLFGILPGLIYSFIIERRFEERATEEADTPAGLFQRFQELDHDLSLLSLEQRDHSQPHFCYPLHATPIGYEGAIQYCFLEEYGDVVFAADPETCADRHVYPVAADFRDFLRLVLACGSASPVEQAVWMTRDQFATCLREEEENRTAEQDNLLELMGRVLDLTPMEAPFDYIKDLQRDFDDSKIQYSQAYYDALGIER